MAYRKNYKKRYSKTARAGRIAARVSRKSYKGALRMPKRKLAKMYATKCGQSAFRAAKRPLRRILKRRSYNIRRTRY